MTDVWEQRIRRAERLAGEPEPAASLLVFYVHVLREQKRAYHGFSNLGDRHLAGSIAADAARIAASGRGLLDVMSAYGPETLQSEARRLLDGPDATRERALLDYLSDRSDRQFFPKALLQPYGQWAADTINKPIAGELDRSEHRCPRCGGAPQLAILNGGASSLEGSGRLLLCATCLSTWAFRRVMCPSCGAEDERQLQYFQSPTLRHVRIDACDACGRYLKTIDLGQLGFAVPLVDEVAAATLDIWASARGYQKLELNLVGL